MALGEHGRRRVFIIIVMGVAGTGKSTLAQSLSDTLDWAYIDGDDLHPRENVEKMSRGEPLGDADRVPWLKVVRETGVLWALGRRCRCCCREDRDCECVEAGSDGKSGCGCGGVLGVSDDVRGVILACSTLKRSYREILRGRLDKEQQGADVGIETLFVWIKGEKALLLDRIGKRQGHFMKATMLDSQFATLESPEDEGDVVTVPLDLSKEEQLCVAIKGLRKLIE